MIEQSSFPLCPFVEGVVMGRIDSQHLKLWAEVQPGEVRLLEVS